MAHYGQQIIDHIVANKKTYWSSLELTFDSIQDAGGHGRGQYCRLILSCCSESILVALI